MIGLASVGSYFATLGTIFINAVAGQVCDSVYTLWAGPTG